MPIIVDKTSQCDICLQRYRPERVPVILPCGHTLCKDCSALICRCHLCRSAFEEDQVLRIHVDFERLPAIVTDSDASLGELPIDLDNVNISELQVSADAMTGFTPGGELETNLESLQSSSPSMTTEQQSESSVAAPTSTPTSNFLAFDAAISSEVLLVAMEGVLRDSMEQHRRELKRLRRLQARQQEELAMAQALALSSSPPQNTKPL